MHNSIGQQATPVGISHSDEPECHSPLPEGAGMRKDQVREPAQALAYLIDCTLATVSDLAMKKSRGTYEFQRQKSIAQTGIDWAIRFGVDLSGTRGADVVGLGSVEAWAAHYDVKPKAAA